MHIQASRLQTALAAPASAVAARLATPAPATSGAAAAGSASTVTISQAAKDLLAQSQASVTLSSRAMDLIQRRNPFDVGAAADTPASASQQAQVRKLMDTLTAQHNNQQISTPQYQHDMAFYTRVANVIG